MNNEGNQMKFERVEISRKLIPLRVNYRDFHEDRFFLYWLSTFFCLVFRFQKKKYKEMSI